MNSKTLGRLIQVVSTPQLLRMKIGKISSVTQASYL